MGGSHVFETLCKRYVIILATLSSTNWRNIHLIPSLNKNIHCNCFQFMVIRGHLGVRSTRSKFNWIHFWGYLKSRSINFIAIFRFSTDITTYEISSGLTLKTLAGKLSLHCSLTHSVNQWATGFRLEFLFLRRTEARKWQFKGWRHPFKMNFRLEGMYKERGRFKIHRWSGIGKIVKLSIRGQ